MRLPAKTPAVPGEIPDANAVSHVPDRVPLDDLRRAFTAKLYAILVDPRSLRALRDLLTHRDPAIRVKAWQVVLPYVAGNGAAVNGGAAANIVIVNHVPRPTIAASDATFRPTVADS
jgi:hypothetical protein